MTVRDLLIRRGFLWLMLALGLLWTASHVSAMLSGPLGAEALERSRPASVPLGLSGEPLDPRRPAETAPAAEEIGAEAHRSAGRIDPPPEVPPMNVLELVYAGGLEMVAIIIVSIIALAFAVERFLALRRHKVVPPELMLALERLADEPEGFDPRRAYQLCRQRPSTAAAVIRAMLLKVGRPHSEVEQAVAEASEREASRLYANVRWQNLAFNVAPMLGLLGTIQGMIVAFFVTSHLPPNVSKAEYLSGGIYRALVNTFAGLAVAIPAAVFAHVLEGRILKLMGELDDLARRILPQLERFEGRVSDVAKAFAYTDDPLPPLRAGAESSPPVVVTGQQP